MASNLAHASMLVNRIVKKAQRALRNQEQDNEVLFNGIHKKFVTANNPVIFDVGAHTGESIRRFRALFKNSIIHSFEADEENYKNLVRNSRNDTNVFVNGFGVGSKDEIKTFHRNLKTNTSSFNPVNKDSDWAKRKSQRHNVEVSAFTAKSYDVRIRPLDDYIVEKNINHVHILKIDTQGYEDEVLKGCMNSLQAGKIDIIETELIVGDAYERSLAFSDIENLLLPCGYKFFAIDRGGDLMREPELALNLLYIRQALL